MRSGASMALASGLGGVLTGCEEKQQPSIPSGSPLSLQAPWSNDAEFIGYYVAMANGYYEQEGLNFTYKAGGPEKNANTELANGSCDIALTNIDGTANAIAKGAPWKIIGTQYQKSPLGIVSLADRGIRKPADLTGRRLAVPPANRSTIEYFFHLNQIDPKKVDIVPYQYDPTILVDGIVDATVDFVTNVPYTIRLRNKTPSSFLLYDFGFKQFMDTVVVDEKTLKSKRKEITGFLRASRKGWNENFKDVDAYPPRFEGTFFKGTGRTVDSEKFFNKEQKPLIESPHGIFSMSDEDIEENIKILRMVGIKAVREMFVTDLLAELS